MRGLIRGAAGIVGVGVAAVVGTTGLDDNTTRNDAGQIVESGGLGAFVMQVGDCFDVPTADLVESVEAFPCSSPHDAEVYANFDLTGATFPGNDEVFEGAQAGCYDRFTGYVGAGYATSSLDFAFFSPTLETWNEIDDRVVTCFVMDYADQKLKVSVQGSGR